jgi:hypothetical protein
MHRSVPVPVAAVAVVLAMAAPAMAGPHGNRTTYTRAYTGGGLDSVGPVPGQWVAGHGQGSDFGAVGVTTSRSDRLVTVAARDDSGRPVMAEVVQEGSRLGESWDLGKLCGKPGTFRLAQPGDLLRVYLLTGSCDSQVSVPTTGTVTLTLVRR